MTFSADYSTCSLLYYNTLCSFDIPASPYLLNNSCKFKSVTHFVFQFDRL